MKRMAFGLAVVCCLMIGPWPFADPPSFVAYAQDDWKAEYEDICSNTENPMPLTAEELQRLIDRCDKLKPRIEKLDETTAKVYLKRLKMCRELFVFVLESKTK